MNKEAKHSDAKRPKENQEIIALRKAMSKALEEKRYEHTLGVAYTAAALAMRYGQNVHKAQMAGLLHDCAKNLTNEKRVDICRKNNIPINAAEEKNPFLLHAKVGSYLAQKKYGISDREILDAITYHTTGRPDMTVMDKIIYIADYIEPGRSQAPGLPEDDCLFRILGDTLDYLTASKMEIDEATRQTYDYYKSLREQNTER